MPRNRRSILYLIALANLAAALAVGAYLWLAWGGDRDLAPDFLLPALSLGEGALIRWTAALYGAALALSLLTYLLSFCYRQDDRPLGAIYLVGMAVAAPGAALAVSALGLGASPFAGILGGALMLLLPLLLFFFEYLMGAVALSLANVAERMNLAGAASAMFAVARGFQPGNTTLLRRRAMADFQRSAFASALVLFERLQARGQMDEEILRGLEVCYRAGKHWAKNVECLDALLKNAPDDPMLLRRLAEGCEHTGDLGRALEARRAILDPTSRRQASHLARLAMRLGRWDEALGLVRGHRALDPPPFRGTQELYGELLAADPQNAEAMEDLAEIQVTVEAEPKAAALWEEVLRTRPDRAESRRKLADYMRRTGNLAGEEAHLRLLASLPGASPGTVLRLAENLTEQDRRAEAATALEQGMDRHPGDFRFPHALCAEALDRGDLEAARKAYAVAELASEAADKPQLAALRRRIEVERDKAEMRSLRERAARRPIDLAAVFELAERLAARGECAEARLALENLLREKPEAKANVLRLLDKIIELADQNYLLLDYKADLNFLDRRFEAALETFQRMAAQSFHGPEALRRGCERILRAEPEYQPALACLGSLMAEAGEWRGVIRVFGRLAELQGECSPDMARHLLDAHMALEQWDEAERYGLLLLRGAPREEAGPLRMRLAELYERRERYVDALKLVDEAMLENPENEELRRAHRLLTRKRKRQRIAEIERETAAHPERLSLHMEAAGLHEEFQEYEKAIAVYQKAARDESLRTLAAAKMGYCLTLVEMYDLADETLRGVQLRADGGEDEEEIKRLLYESARLFEKNDTPSKALGMYKTIFRADAGFRDVVSRIVRLGG